MPARSSSSNARRHSASRPATAPSPDKLELLTADEAAYRQARASQGGVPVERSLTFTASVSDDERTARYEENLA